MPFDLTDPAWDALYPDPDPLPPITPPTPHDALRAIRPGGCSGSAKGVHIGYVSNHGWVSLCGAGNGGVFIECRCHPWSPQEITVTEVTCEACFELGRQLKTPKEA